MDFIIEENESQGKRRVKVEDQQKELRLRKELEAQKARIIDKWHLLKKNEKNLSMIKRSREESMGRIRCNG